MYIAKDEIESLIKDGDKVLDIGSWNDVFPRADVMIDVNPYETRKNQYPDEKEYFSKETWLQSDINKMETWENFADKEFDFVICSHLLEDIRDPMFVCEQLIRVSKRGYIEVPTRYRECSRVAATDTVSGYDHHRWLVDVLDGSLVFTAKLHWAHTVDYLTEEKRDYLNFHNFHYFGVFWDDSFHYYERCPKGELLEGANLLYQFDELDISQLHEKGQLSRNNNKSCGNMLWVDQFSLPVEGESKDVMQHYLEKYQALCMEKTHQIVSQKSEMESQKPEVERLNESLNVANVSCSNQAAEIERLRASLNEVFGSKSWRITEPLRKFMASCSMMTKSRRRG